MDNMRRLSFAPSYLDETPVQPEDGDAATFSSSRPGETATTHRTANVPRLRKLNHRKSTSKSTNDAPSTSTATNAEPSTATAPGLTPGLLRARIKHKRVEKQYRNRLSAQFERLLSVLPAERFHRSDDEDAAMAGESGEGSRWAGLSARVDGRTVTRAEVLDVAVRFIEESQQQR